MSSPRVHLTWRTAGMVLTAIEPTPGEVARHAEALAEAYNDPANATLLGHVEALTQADVIEHYADLDEDGARQFLLYVDGALAGDADLRGLEDGAAEFAFLIGRPSAQGRGLGTRFAIMLHAYGFAPPPAGCGLTRIFASVVPDNAASLRVFEKLGYAEERGPSARVWADAPDDVVLSIGASTFAAAHRGPLAEIVLERR